jgi:hypothetical protein
MKLTTALNLFLLTALTTVQAGALPDHCHTTTAPASSCIVGGAPCPTGSTCTETSTCGGLCQSIYTPPPVVPCTVGETTNTPCGPSSTCTPTMVCTITGGPCGGQCIAKATSPPSCTPGKSNNCPTGSTCASTSGGALCVATPAPTVPCVLGGNNCPPGSACTQTETCHGLCIQTA